MEVHSRCDGGLGYRSAAGSVTVSFRGGVMKPYKSGFNQKQYNQPTDKQKRERLEAAMRRVNTNLYPKTSGGKNG